MKGFSVHEQQSSDNLENCFTSKTVYQRAAIVIAGPLANFLLAVGAYWLVFLSGEFVNKPMIHHVTHDSVAYHAGLTVGDVVVAINGKEVSTLTQVEEQLLQATNANRLLQIEVVDLFGVVRMLRLPDKQGVLNPKTAVSNQLGFFWQYPGPGVMVGEVLPASAAMRAQLQPGDVITRMNNQQVKSWEHWQAMLKQQGSAPMVLVIRRGDQVIERLTAVELMEYQGEQRMLFGVTNRLPDAIVKKEYTISQAFIRAWVKTGEVIQLGVSAISGMLAGSMSFEHMKGPIGIAQMTARSADYGAIAFVAWLALLSVNVGLINLLPVPMLDGGHLVFLGIEALGKPIPMHVQQRLLYIGFGLLVALMLVTTWNDLGLGTYAR